MCRGQLMELRPPRTMDLDQPLAGEHVQDSPRTLRCEPCCSSQLRRRLQHSVRSQGAQDPHVTSAAAQRRQRMPEVALGFGGSGQEKKRDGHRKPRPQVKRDLKSQVERLIQDS